MCLDWREICDGKLDCLDSGADEEHCWQLETLNSSEYSNEYRCHNGMHIIPKDFFRDGQFNPDCIDRSDESLSATIWKNCYRDPAFRCEEHMCHSIRGKTSFPCGDGHCVNDLNQCRNLRGYLASYKTISSTISHSCRNAMECLTKMFNSPVSSSCASIVQTSCPSIYQFPSRFVALGHIFFLYSNTNVDMTNEIIYPSYVCYDRKQCNTSILLSNSSLMYHGSDCLDWNFHFDHAVNWFGLIIYIEQFFIMECFPKVKTHHCFHSEQYRCVNSSKCISKRRLLDGIQDCMANDDETLSNSCHLNETFRFQCSDQPTKCLSSVLVNDGVQDCLYGEDETSFAFSNQQTRMKISFPMTCDYFEELKSIEINEHEHTDETECQYWPCETTYTRCNHIWNCPNGFDERNCDGISSVCHSFDQLCLSQFDYNRTCQQIDENYQWKNPRSYLDQWILCVNTSLINHHLDCSMERKYLSVPLICEFFNGQSIEQRKWPFTLTHRLFACNIDPMISNRTISCYLTRHAKHRFHYAESIDVNWIDERMLKEQRRDFPNDYEWESILWYCHRGIPIDYRTNIHCLCPPSYYGNRCQYENERVSLTLKIISNAESKTMLTIIVLLVDENGEIQSHDQIHYIQSMDCELLKFNNYLLYRSRPKNFTKDYRVLIHVYNRRTFEYRGSWFYPIRYSFLPVQRLSIQILIPPNLPDRCSHSCGSHGQCYRYINREDSPMFVCRCDPGWTGRECTIPHETCQSCADHSLCVDKDICLCPVEKYGPRCYLTSNVCELAKYKCQNGGVCVPSDIRRARSLSVCFCLEGFSGIFCEIIDQKMIFTFHSDLNLPETLRIYLIKDKNYFKLDEQIAMFARIPFHQNSVTLYTSMVFKLIFVSLSSTEYYLTNPMKDNQTVSIDIQPMQRCLHVRDLFNQTVASLHLLRRIKYYHRPCQENRNLICFYDERHLCRCTDYNRHREANCYNSTHDNPSRCQAKDNGGCLNGAECFQDTSPCATSVLCNCPQCYYGIRCHFTTQTFSLTLDAILGYQIQPMISWKNQFFIVHASAAFVSVFLLIGLVGNSFSILTFTRETTLQVGCGNYLLINAIISLLAVVFLTLKFWLLVLAQMLVIVHQSFLMINCRSMDFLLRFFLSTNDWLTACVAIERVFVVLKGISFNKDRSRSVARWISVFLIMIIAASQVHDPLHRQWLHIPEEERTWCIVTYEPFIRLFDTLVVTLHFLGPFLINLLSAVAVIIVAARRRSAARKEKTYREHLHEQLRLNRHLLISPCILVLLALPRLIISLVSGCIQARRTPWLLLIGYFISFLPATLHFLVFVLPSKTYKEEFLTAAKELRQRCFFKR